ncbi:hypothetical protein WG901_03145 [Novosphingobium sp. PS1R-30]|uniref:Secreted protein n=1 Tax=Novosphingobium anseongense TaxID=3133436 RepID=A0ABU8RRA6_9SPHN
MRRLVHFLVILTVLLCGTHLSPAEADALTDHATEARAHAEHGDEVPGDSHTGAAHAGHHHCPIAPDPHAMASQCDATPMTPLLFDRPVARLRSRATAPPIQPPAA